MAQTTNQIVNQVGGGSVLYANNNGVTSAAGEIIVLDGIGVLGFRNIAVTVFNYASSASTISSVKLYGSPDGLNYMAVSGFSLATITAGNLGHAEVACSFKYLRVTTTGAAECDVYLYATI